MTHISHCAPYTQSELLGWRSEGLPTDSLSSQNAVVILNAAPMAPLIIDPSTQVRCALAQLPFMLRYHCAALRVLAGEVMLLSAINDRL